MKISHSVPRVQPMRSSNGNDVVNQLIIRDVTVKAGGKNHIGDVFQSYDSIIAFRCPTLTILDERVWDYSVTTSKYRNQFLNEDKKTTQLKIDRGWYKLGNLNN